MKTRFLCIVLLATAVTGCGGSIGSTFSESDPMRIEDSSAYALGGERSAGPMFYVMTTEIIHYSPDGTRSGVDSLVLFLRGAIESAEETYVCGKFFVRKAGESASYVPSLAGWSYSFRPDRQGGDLLGIDRSKFVNLTTSEGMPLPPDIQYAVYNSFVDFHTIANVFARPTNGGKGVQDLHRIGEKVVHVSAFSEPPVDVGENVKKGSYFRNGEITLELKGLSRVDGKPCALIGYDSGNSAFRMIIQPTTGMEIVTTGGSHYFGDIYLDLRTKWVDKATMGEIVVSETKLSTLPSPAHNTIERKILIRSIGESSFTSAVHP